MQALKSTAGMAVAAILLIASLAGLWHVLPGNVEIWLTGEMLSGFAREHPLKPWHGFETSILDVSVDREVHIKAHVSGHLIHTPIEIAGTPQYASGSRSMFFHVSKAELPREAARPMLGRLNAMLNPLATYIARHLTDAIPIKRITQNTPGGALFLASVRSVRVDGNVVVVEVHGYHLAAATALALMLTALLAAARLIAGPFRGGMRPPRQPHASATRRQE